ncbi:MAG: MG2 domain-containing protein, partial [Geobacteraceae bacterium]|nr:MG2 domain-containing protein [Geobacteraceae bacterium]
KLEPLPPGSYLLIAEGNGTVAHSSFLVTRLGLVAKSSPAGTLLFAADLVDGHALEGVEILEAAVSPGASALPVLLGKTGIDGLFASPSKARSVRFIGRKDDNLAIFHVSALQDGGQGLKGYLYTERSAYRPGQTVFFKGVLRKIVGEGYALPGTETVRVTITDSGDQTLMEKEYPVSSSGSFNGEVVLPAQPPLGDYSVRAVVGGYTFQASFKVLEYRKPEFEVTVAAGKKFHVGGDQVPVSLKARYYFGAPVVDGKVRYRIYSRPYYRFGGDQDGDNGDNGEDLFGGYADFLGEAEVTTDSEGMVLVTINTKPLESPRAYTVEFDITDSAGRVVSATASFTVTPSLINLTVRPLSYLCSPGKKTDIEVATSTWEGKSVSARVLVTVAEQVYDKNARRYSYRKLNEREVDTDASGRMVFVQTFPRPGYWRVSAVTTDERGLKAAGVGWVWVWREGYAWDTSYRELGVELDKKIYKPGETARIIVKSPVAGAALLLTVEGREIYSRRVVPSAGSVEVVEIPVTEDMAPYVFVSAVMIEKGHFYSRTRNLRVDSRPDLLDLTVSTDKDLYEPGEKVRLSIAARGGDALPRETELSLAVVDEALFAVAPETQPDIYRFFRGTREHRVLTLNSFPRVYLGGAAKAGMSTLADDKLQGIKVRKVFKDTAFWLPILTTGADGKAEAEFELPDNLTTWRATAVGFTDRSEFGTGRDTFIARLDVMARLQPPRFLTVGDRMKIPGIITNMTDSERDVTGIFEASGLSLLGESRFSGTVAPGGTLRRDMSVKAEVPGESLLRLRASAGDRGDAMELTLPVFMRGMKRMSQGNIVLRGTEGETEVNLPGDAMDEGASLDLSVAPSLTASLNESLAELIDFPYGCVEQTMSRFLPAVQVKKLLGSSRFSLSPDVSEKLERVLDEGLRRLYDFQHEDGGWGWWKEDATDPYMTAHVMNGLALARKAGVPVRNDSYERGVQSLTDQMKKVSLEALPSLYRAYVLAGRSDDAAEKRIEAGWRQLQPSQRVQYVAALQKGSQKGRATLLLDDLKKKVKREGSAAWLQDDDANSWWYSWRWSGSAVETTAMLLECQLALDSHDSLVSSL